MRPTGSFGALNLFARNPMKPNSLRTAALAAPLFGIAIFYGCAPSDPTVTNPITGGTGGSAMAGTAPVAGTAAAGPPASGGTGTAGTPATGGSSAGTPAGGTGGSGAGTAGTGGSNAGGTGGARANPPGQGDLGPPTDISNPRWIDARWVTGGHQKGNT